MRHYNSLTSVASECRESQLIPRTLENTSGPTSLAPLSKSKILREKKTALL